MSGYSTISAGSELITCQHLRRIVGRQPLFLLDVREPEEFVEGHIDGAVNIPLGALSKRVGELPRDVLIVCVCHSGRRSLEATRRLQQCGLHARSLDTGMVGWGRSAGVPSQTVGYPAGRWR